MAVSTSSAEFRDAPEAQDWAALGDWLAAQGMQLDARDPRQFAGGLANLNYLIHVDGTLVVLRRPPGGALAEGASDMGREARVLSILPDHYPLAPRSIAYCADRDVIGAEFQLIEYRPGVTIRDTLPGQMRAAPGIGGELTRRYVEALAALHSIDAEAAGLSGLARRPEGFVRRQTDGWERRARVAFGDDVPEPAGRILAWLRANQPPQGGVALLHNDFKFDNLILDPATGDLRAVVDWDMSTLGDPLFDLGVALSYWIEPGDPPALHALGQAPSLEPGFPGRSELAAAYFRAAGRDAVPMGFYLTLARFRMAVAWQQMYVLHRRGALAGPRYATFNRLAGEILDWTAGSLDAEPA